MSLYIVDDEQRRDRPQDHASFGFRRRGGICFVTAPQRCAVTSLASRRLASTPAALGTRPLPVLRSDPQPAHSCSTSSGPTEHNAVRADGYDAAAEGWFYKRGCQ